MGLLFSSVSPFDPAKDLLDLTGKVAVVTGGNAGIGYWTVLHLRKRGAKVYLGARNESKAKAAIESMNILLNQEKNVDASVDGTTNVPSFGEVVYFHVDLEDPRVAQKAAREILAKENRLDILVNNAGRIPTEFRLTKEGIVSTMVINHISPFVFTLALSPLLESTAHEEGSDVRIVTLTSEINSIVSKSQKYDSLEDFNNTCGSKTAYFSSMKRYGISKLANIIVSNELQRKYDEKKVPITCISVHPGRVRTDTAIEDVSKFPLASLALWFMRITFNEPEQGSYNSLFAAASPAVKQQRDKYKASFLMPIGKISQANPRASDSELAKTLFETSERILKERYELLL